MVGQLNWVATQSRPDMSFTVVELSAKTKTPEMEDLKRINKAFNYLTSNPTTILFPKLSGDLHIETFSDAVFRNLPDKI